MDNKKCLLTEDEFEKEIVKRKETIFGKLFPFHPDEFLCLFLILSNTFIISGIYTFYKNFKEIIIYRNMSQVAKNWFKIGIFVSTFIFVNVTNNKFNRHGYYRGYNYLLFVSISIFVVLSIFLLAEQYFLKDAMVNVKITTMMHTWLSVRSLGWTLPLVEIMSCFSTSFMYIFYEMIPSQFMTVISGVFISSYLTPKSFKRYIPFIILTNNISPLVVSFLTDNYIKQCGNSSVKVFNQHLLFVNFIIVLSFLGLRVMSYFIHSNCSKKLFIPSQSDRKPKSVGNKKVISTYDALKTMSKSKIILALTVIALGINCVDMFFASYAGTVYEQYALYLQKTPSENTTPGLIPTKNNIALPYNLKESFYSALLTCYLITLPIIPCLFDLYGPLLYGLISPIIGFLGFLTILFLSSINYQFNNDMNPLIFGLRAPVKAPCFKLECTSVCFINIAIKVSKFVFHATVRENISVLFSPSIRILVKGFVEGVIGKGSKTIISVWFIILDYLFSKDCIYTLPLSFIFFIFVMIFWIIANFYVHKQYIIAFKNNTYISDD